MCRGHVTHQVPPSVVSPVVDSALTSEFQLARHQVQGQGQEDGGRHPLPLHPTRVENMCVCVCVCVCVYPIVSHGIAVQQSVM